jgi:hypothetical protein
MARITRKQLDTMEQRLNATLGRPEEAYLDGKAQIGNIHLQGVNGAYNVYEVNNSAGGVKGLAYGLSTREAYEWLQGALTAVRLITGTHPGF